MQYTSNRPLQEALCCRLRELAATHVRYGYRRLTVLLRREGWMVNAKRVYRLYDQENLKVRSVERKKISRRQRVPQGPATGPNQCWSADFVSDKLTDGRSYRILTVIDQFTRECVAWMQIGPFMGGMWLLRLLALLRSVARRREASLWTTAASSLVGRWKPGRFNMGSSYASSAQGAQLRTASSKASTVDCAMNA